jgi:hypothetical protein
MAEEPIELPIDGVLDLHTFKPGEVKDLVPDYLAACQARGILQVRIIHAQGHRPSAPDGSRNFEKAPGSHFVHPRSSAIWRLGRDARMAAPAAVRRVSFFAN